MICLISQPLLIASRRDWHRSKGLFKGFKLVLRPWESSKNWQRYDQMKFVTEFSLSIAEQRAVGLILAWSLAFLHISIFLLPNCFPFHHLQFLSSLLQYSWSYFLSDHPNSFLAINLPGNSSLLNIPFLCSCLATSSMSHRYSFSNSLIASFVFFKFSLLSQVLDSAVNPFQCTRYFVRAQRGAAPDRARVL